MTFDFEDQYFNQLRAIEQAINSFARQHDDLVDFQVDKVLSGLEREYTAELRGKNPPRLKLKSGEVQLYTNIKQALALYLGRDADVDIGEEAITVEEAVACIKRIRRSVNLMRDQGRRGYIEFIAQFFVE